MAQFRCDKCGFVSEEAYAADACPNCGISVANLFDLGAADAAEAEPAPTARLKPRSLPLQPQDSAVELSEADLQDVSSPPPPLAPRLAAGPLLKASTLELEDGDLEEVSPPPLALPLPAGNGQSEGTRGLTVEPSRRSLRGRVAVPIHRLDQTPVPSTLPPGADELAIAGQPPRPQQDRRLAGQTEMLAAIRARQHKRLLVPLASAALVLLTAAGIAQLWPSPGSQMHAALQPLPVAQEQTAPLAEPDAAVRSLVALSVADASLPEAVTPPPAAVPRAAKATADPTPKPTPPVAGGVRHQEQPSAAEANPEARALYQQGLQLLLRGQAQLAVDRFNQALRQDPQFSLAYRGLGLAYEKLGSAAMARASFQQYLSANSGAPDAEAIGRRLVRLR